MTEAVRKLKKSENMREALIDFKNRLKNGEIRLTKDDVKFIITLLKQPDPKSRKNVAQILSLAADPGTAGALIAAYESEDTEYVKASYLAALVQTGYEGYEKRLESLRQSLLDQPVNEENKKHIDEQAQMFNELLGMVIGRHVFTGYELPSELVLITQRGLSLVTADQIQASTKRVLGIGVFIKTDKRLVILKIRSYKELLFTLPDQKRLPMDPYKAAELLAEGSLKAFLDRRHDNDMPWGYRLSVVSRMDDKKKALFIKRFAGELSRHSSGAFVNTASDYELEIRLLESKDGDFTLMLKLFTIADTRFSYRRETIAQSIRPELAATLCILSEDYMRAQASVLDPFCGVGTMLIERCHYKNAKNVYGVDLFGEAVKKARINTEAEGLSINYVNRDYFEFQNDEPFDEIFTNMPFSLRPEDGEEIRSIYERFFAHSKELLKQDGFMIVYVRDIEYAREFSLSNSFIMEKEMLISDKEDSYLCIYRNKGD